MAKRTKKASSVKNSRILEEEMKVEDKLSRLSEIEQEIEQKEDVMGQETKNVEKLEEEIKKEVAGKPLSKFSLNDLNKGIIGAFIGVVAHFAFVYGKEIALQISAARAGFLLVFSYALIIILMYETGYRQIKEKRIFSVLPRRATIIYFISIVMVIVIFALFNMLDFSDAVGMYKQIAVTSVLASLGAGTADLIGRR